jgi:CheY-like chemotaxis protein
VVHEASNGREGLAACETCAGAIDLLLTDVVMPQLGGRELADMAKKLRPDMKVLFMSGHTEDVVIKEGVQKGTAFLQKPFTPAGLAEKVRETLDRNCRPPHSRNARGTGRLRISGATLASTRTRVPRRTPL